MFQTAHDDALPKAAEPLRFGETGSRPPARLLGTKSRAGNRDAARIHVHATTPYATPTTNPNTRATRAGQEQTANNEQIKNAPEPVKREGARKSTGDRLPFVQSRLACPHDNRINR